MKSKLQHGFILLLFAVFGILAFVACGDSGDGGNISSGDGTVDQSPVITAMVSTDTDKLSLAWLPATDNATPADQVVYEVHLSKSVTYEPDSSTLKKTIVGERQTTVVGLEPDTTYYAIILAVFPDGADAQSNPLSAKTFAKPVLKNAANTVKQADELGLGKYTASDATSLTFPYDANAVLPEAGTILFAEGVDGEIVLRRVVSTVSANPFIIITTAAASLTDVFEDATISSAFHLVDVGGDTNFSRNVSTATVGTDQHYQSSWDDGFLTIEQVDYSHDEQDRELAPMDINTEVTSEFDVQVTPSFEPVLETYANWSGFQLNSAVVTARGTLSIEALAQYNFEAQGTWEDEVEIFNRPWTSIYYIGTVPVYQQITLSIKVAASAEAQAKIKASTSASISRTVEVGATYTSAGGWETFLNETNDESLTADLDIGAEASAEVRIIPEVRVTFYTVLSSYLSVEPYLRGGLAVEETTNNLDFLAIHPDRLLELTTFESALGLESFIGADLTVFGNSFPILEKICVLGPVSNASCTANIDELTLFSLPQLTLTVPQNSNSTQEELKLEAIHGVNNPFDPASVQWEVFPSSASIEPHECSDTIVNDQTKTTCTATLSMQGSDEYTVFASGQGVLGELARQFEEGEIYQSDCIYGTGTGIDDVIVYWKRCKTSRELTYINQPGDDSGSPNIVLAAKVICNEDFVGECPDPYRWVEVVFEGSEIRYIYLFFLSGESVNTNYYCDGDDFYGRLYRTTLDNPSPVQIGNSFVSLAACRTALSAYVPNDGDLIYPGSCQSWWDHDGETCSY